MARFKREAKGKKINPTLFVFCEGESEEMYIRYLRSIYRLPVEIVTKITRNQVSERKIKGNLKNAPRHEKDKIYLMYDLDVDGFLNKLQAIQKETQAMLIVSNPCFELWYLCHFCNQTSEINTDNCIKKLQSFCKHYKKGSIPSALKMQLEIQRNDAIANTKEQLRFENPSTNVYLFIEELEKIRK